MLKSLFIQNFRSLEDFYVPKLGQVNLVVGKNNSGKSSVLEALRIYSGNANRILLEEIATSHDEKYRYLDKDGEDVDGELPFQGFFSGRIFSDRDGDGITIGENRGSSDLLKIEHVFLEEYEDNLVDETGATITRSRRRPVQKSSMLNMSDEIIRNGLMITKGDRSVTFAIDVSGPRYRPSALDMPGMVPCSVVPTQFVSMNDLARDWDKIVLSKDALFVENALRTIAKDVEGLAFVESGEGVFVGGRREIRRIAKVKLSNLQRAVPIGSLGDGMVRVLQLMLKVFPAKGGMLLVDEFENGLHYSVQKDIWELVFEQAKELGIQVFATTHSWDCIKSFAEVARDRQDVEGILFRVGRSILDSNKGKVISTVFNEEQLYDITQSDLEVR